MPFDDYKVRIFINGFTDAQRDSIFADLRTAYDGSAIARSMFDNWFADAQSSIVIEHTEGKYAAILDSGELFIDPDFLADISYISVHGRAVPDTQLAGLLHELGHALAGKDDNHDLPNDDFMGDNVRFVNTMWEQLGLPLQVSYVGHAPVPVHVPNYEYTNGIAIDGALSSGDTLLQTGKTNDLLISGSASSVLQAGTGTDFLVGGGGDDSLWGGDGKDTAVYLGNPVDYDIRRTELSSWEVRHVRGAKDEGADTLWNMEQLQFGKELYALKKSRLTFQTDFALVVDTSGSMGSSIAGLQAKATSLIDALFADGKTDARVGIVGFKDAANGEPSTIVLPFTEQDAFADRKAAAVAAIKGLGASGGGDTPETSFDGLLKALDGSMGQWRVGAGTRRIVLITDAPPKDGALEQAVRTYAQSIGAAVETSAGKTSSLGAPVTFDLTLPPAPSGAANLMLPDDGDPLPEFTFIDEPVIPDTSVATLEIYTIFTGATAADTRAFSSISASTGGALLAAPTGGDVVAVLQHIIGGLELVGTPDADVLLGGLHIDKLSGLEGDDSLDGGANADTMIGGPGDDTYAVDHPKDSVVEAAEEGSDSVERSRSTCCPAMSSGGPSRAASAPCSPAMTCPMRWPAAWAATSSSGLPETTCCWAAPETTYCSADGQRRARDPAG